MDAHRHHCFDAPFDSRNSQRSPENISCQFWYASFAFATASLPRSVSARSAPIASSRLSASVSTRETKKLATDDDRARVAARRRRAARARGVGLHHLARGAASEKISVTLIDLPAAIMSSIAGRPACVAGIFT